MEVKAEVLLHDCVKVPGSACMDELTCWCKKWGPFTADALFRSVEIRAAFDDVCIIKAEVYASVRGVSALNENHG